MSYDLLGRITIHAVQQRGMSPAEVPALLQSSGIAIRNGLDALNAALDAEDRDEALRQVEVLKEALGGLGLEEPVESIAAAGRQAIIGLWDDAKRKAGVVDQALAGIFPR